MRAAYTRNSFLRRLVVPVFAFVAENLRRSPGPSPPSPSSLRLCCWTSYPSESSGLVVLPSFGPPGTWFLAVRPAFHRRPLDRRSCSLLASRSPLPSPPGSLLDDSSPPCFPDADLCGCLLHFDRAFYLILSLAFYYVLFACVLIALFLFSFYALECAVERSDYSISSGLADLLPLLGTALLLLSCFYC
ncbi:hypothetical protein NPIL_462471 [Nephila pilipes]|uniref:Uncharacterized protein n=1 Tax=Nephila pilipes TaxID=299642 RepID=A0A8X6II03_NEPPI|nr:hypothetical protein NPIL_462471 [Nephila pilipes]